MTAKIPGIEKVGNVFGTDALYVLSKVVCMVFGEDRETNTYTLTIDLESEPPRDRYRARLEFVGVRELRIRGFGGCLTQINGLDIVDVSERQLEGIRYRVEDYEHDSIGFMCQLAAVSAIEKVII